MIEAREQQLEITMKALKAIVNPIDYLNSELKDGEKLDGHVAIMLIQKPVFYQDIAKKALAELEFTLDTPQT